MTPNEPGPEPELATLYATRRTFRSNPRDILRLLHCPKCDYSLQGLPRRHRCPECGFEYDESMFAIYGWPTSADRPSVWRPAVTLALLAGYVVCAFLFLPSRGATWLLLLYLVGASALATETWIRRRRAQRERGGVIQLVFSSSGAARRVGAGPVDFVPWRKLGKFRIRRVGPNRWRLRLGSGIWRLYAHSRSPRPIVGKPLLESTIECSRREAALLRREIRRRLEAAGA